jgi:hypothetical protein
MEFIYTLHARERMLERGVTEDEILYVLFRYSLTFPADNGGTSLLAYFPDGSHLTVWVANPMPITEPIIVKSVGRKLWNDHD